MGKLKKSDSDAIAEEEIAKIIRAKSMNDLKTAAKYKEKVRIHKVRRNSMAKLDMRRNSRADLRKSIKKYESSRESKNQSRRNSLKPIKDNIMNLVEQTSDIKDRDVRVQIQKARNMGTVSMPTPVDSLLESELEKKYETEINYCGMFDKRCLEFGIKAFVICGSLAVASSMLIYNNITSYIYSIIYFNNYSYMVY